MAAKTDIAIGDRFRKVGNFQMPIWTVARISCPRDNVPHAHLERNDNPNDFITVGLPALADRSLYDRLPATAAPLGGQDGR